jgi:hypothetical protein
MTVVNTSKSRRSPPKETTSSAKEFVERACFHLALKCAAVVCGRQAAERLVHAWLCQTDYPLHSYRSVVRVHSTKLLPGSPYRGCRQSLLADILKANRQLRARISISGSAVVIGL